MSTRRQFLGASLLTAGGMMAARAWSAEPSAAGYRMPDEGEGHAATWMAFGPSLEVWGTSLLPVVRRDLARVAQAIAAHEPVRMLTRAEDMALAAKLCGPKVELAEQPLDDLWIRDSGPIFVKGKDGAAAVDFNFNGWGGKQAHRRDAKVAAAVAAKAGVPVVYPLGAGRRRHRGGWRRQRHHHRKLRAQRQPQSRLEQGAVRARAAPLAGRGKVIWSPRHRRPRHH